MWKLVFLQNTYRRRIDMNKKQNFYQVSCFLDTNPLFFEIDLFLFELGRLNVLDTNLPRFELTTFIYV